MPDNMTDAKRQAIIDRIRWINTHTRLMQTSVLSGKAKPR